MRNRPICSHEEIYKMHLDGLSTKEISEISGVTDRSIRRILSTKFNAQLQRSGRKPIYEYNRNFFKSWSPSMAYTLGLIATDGGVGEKVVRLAQKDPEILFKIKESMGASTKVFKRKNGESHIYFLDFHSMDLIDELRSYNITRRKSLTLEPPAGIPEDCLNHFIRGVIDGDGHIQYNAYTVTITTGSCSFASWLNDLFLSMNLKSRIRKQEFKNTVYRVYISGKSDVLQLGNWVYRDDGGLFIEKKKKTFMRNAPLFT